MAEGMTEEAIQQRIIGYKQRSDREERIETAEEIGAAVRQLAQAIVRHYDGRAGTDEMTALFRLCQIPDAATLAKKRERVDKLDLPTDVKEDIKSTIPDTGLVGGGIGQLLIAEKYETDTYQLLETLIRSEDRDELDAAIDEFANLDIDGIQAGVLSPILFFLHPSTYPVINSASRSGIEAITGRTVSRQLSDYMAEAEQFRDFRDRYDLGGEDGNLRDVDLFLYTLDPDSEPAVWVETTAIHGEYKKPGSGELALGRALISAQRGKHDRDIYATLREVAIGDIVVHVLKDSRTIAGISVVASELITDYDFPEAVEERWDESQRKQGGYLRKLTDFRALDNPPQVYNDLLDNPTYKNELNAIYEAHSGLFYNTNRNLAQGKYFTRSPHELAEIFADVSPELRDYFESHGLEIGRGPTTQMFQIPLSDTRSMRENFERTVRGDVSAALIEDIVDTDFEREWIRVWASGKGGGDENPGDILLFADRETEEYTNAATVASSEQLSEAEAREFCEAVGWEHSEQYQYLIYLDEVYDIDLPAEQFWELMDYKDFPRDGFSRIYPARIEDSIVANDDYGSVEEFLENISTDRLFPDQGSGDDEPNPTYYLWNTNYQHAGTNGSEAFKRDVAAAYGGDTWGRKLSWPEQGDILCAYLVRTGVIGVGEVIEGTDTEPIDKTDLDADPIKGPETLEYHLPVDWTYTLSNDSAVEISRVADLLNRKKMSRVGTIETPADQQGAAELYQAVRRRFIQLHETSPHAAHQNTDIERLIETKKQVVFYGPPGTGKTYTANRFAEWLRANRDANVLGTDQIRTVTFHPSFSYEDFLEGFTAKVVDDDVAYDYQKGVFAKIVRDAKEAYNQAGDGPAPPFVLVIDEINRGNLAQIFGETITLLEADKRLDQDNEVVTELAHSGEKFVVPPNLYVIGTMNTADESIALVDTALRRRFRFLSFPPQFDEVIDEYALLAEIPDLETVLQEADDPRDQLVAASILALRSLNAKIVDLQHLGKGKQIGHTYLFGLETPEAVVDAWRFEILPQLEEYYFGQFKRLKRDLFDGDGSELINWDTNEIEAFDAWKLYEALCQLAGFGEKDYEPLAGGSTG